MGIAVELEGDASKQILRHIVCAVCTDVLERPIMRTPCDHVFCEPCIRASLQFRPSCPLDHTALDASQLTRDVLLERMVGDLPCKCPHADRCSWAGQVDNVASHLRHCAFEPVKCDHCSQFFSKSDIDSHAETCKPAFVEPDVAPIEPVLDATRSPIRPAASRRATGSLDEQPIITPIAPADKETMQTPFTFLLVQLLLFALFSPRKLWSLRTQSYRAHQRTQFAVELLLAFLSLVPLLVGLSLVGFGLVSSGTDGLLPRSCATLAVMLAVMAALKWITVQLPYMFGLDISDELLAKLFLALFFAYVSVTAALNGKGTAVDMGIIAASSVGTFVIYYLRQDDGIHSHRGFSFNAPPVQLTVLDFFTLSFVIVGASVRSSLPPGIAFDIGILLAYILTTWVAGILTAPVPLHFIATTGTGVLSANAAQSEPDNNNMSRDPRQRLGSVSLLKFTKDILMEPCGLLFLLRGNTIGGTTIIYALSAAHFTRPLLFPSKTEARWRNARWQMAIVWRVVGALAWAAVNALALYLSGARMQVEEEGDVGAIGKAICMSAAASLVISVTGAVARRVGTQTS